MSFPPIPVYPDAIDDDYTLFLVHNTTESLLSKDNEAWSQDIHVVPVGNEELEIWSTNGFANISGELLYYDNVEYNESGKIKKLRNCARNLGGEKTKFNAKGTWIRSFVVAEHHNQLVRSVLKTENFIGANFDDREDTLDWRIRNLESLNIIFDDYNCPDVTFNFETIQDDPVLGRLTRYNIEITPPGIINSFRIDFGDGESSTTNLFGTHRYAINASVDPVVTVGNEKCQIVATPLERNDPQEPQLLEDEVFSFPIPEFQDVPEFIYVPIEVPEPDITLPPQVFPCVSFEGADNPNGPFAETGIFGPDGPFGPSGVFGTNGPFGPNGPFRPGNLSNPDGTTPGFDFPDIPSNIDITGPDHPVNILHSVVEIVGGSEIPDTILIDPPIPPTIIVDPPIPPTIVIVPPASSIVLALDASSAPRLEVDWGIPPDMEIALTLAKDVRKVKRFAPGVDLTNEFGEEFADIFDKSNAVEVNYESVGIPEEIQIVPPRQEDMPKIQIELPEEIKINSVGLEIPNEIKIFGPDQPIPDRIELFGAPTEIDLVYQGDPIAVQVETEVTLKFEEIEFPTIKIEIPKEIPRSIELNYNGPKSIDLNIPNSISLVIPENVGIPLLIPEKMPEIELVYKGAPLEFKISMDEIISNKVDGSKCFMMVPCSN